MDSGRIQPPMLAGQVPDPAIQSVGPEDSARQKNYPPLSFRDDEDE